MKPESKLIPRDPNRIDKMTELLREAWHLQPDFRLTQLVMAVTDKPEDGGAVWYTEDDIMEQKLRKWIEGWKRRKKE